MAYIDKDLAIKTAIDMCVKVVGHGITQIDAVDIADAFEDIPTADVVEVRHGYWVRRTSYPMGYNCSECYGFESYKRPFCCVCGAKMDLSEKPTGCEGSDT